MNKRGETSYGSARRRSLEDDEEDQPLCSRLTNGKNGHQTEEADINPGPSGLSESSANGKASKTRRIASHDDESEEK